MTSPISPASSHMRSKWTPRFALSSSHQRSLTDRCQEVPKSLRSYWDDIRDELSVEDGLVTKGVRIILPTSMRPEILSGIHPGRQGSEKCKLRTRTCIYWPLMNDIEELVSKCSTCQTHRKSHQPKTLLPQEVPSRPWEVLGSDTLTLHGHDYLLMCDYYSKNLIVRRVPTRQSNSPTVVKLLKQIFWIWHTRAFH